MQVPARTDVLFYVDGTQGWVRSSGCIGHPPSMLSVMAIMDAAPAGAGFMYIEPGVREWLQPQCHGWRSHHHLAGITRIASWRARIWHESGKV